MSKPLNVQIITRARSLIEDKERWCSGAVALDARGTTVSPISSQATKRCALGALIASAYEIINDYGQANILAINAVRSFQGISTLVNINDARGHAAVLAFFDEAIASG